MSHHRNPRVAGQEAAEKALEAAGLKQADFVFMFASVGYDQRALLDAVRKATGGAPLCGSSGEGIIAGMEADESNFSVGVMTIASDELRFSNAIATGLKEGSEEAGRTMARAFRGETGSDTGRVGNGVPRGLSQAQRCDRILLSRLGRSAEDEGRRSELDHRDQGPGVGRYSGERRCHQRLV